MWDYTRWFSSLSPCSVLLSFLISWTFKWCILNNASPGYIRRQSSYCEFNPAHIPFPLLKSDWDQDLHLMPRDYNSKSGSLLTPVAPSQESWEQILPKEDRPTPRLFTHLYGASATALENIMANSPSSSQLAKKVTWTCVHSCKSTKACKHHRKQQMEQFTF